MIGQPDRLTVLLAALGGSKDPARDATLTALFRAGEAASERKDAAELERIIGLLNAETGLDFTPDFFAIMHGGAGPDYLAQAWSAPIPAPVNGLTPKELRALLAQLRGGIADPQLERRLLFLERSLGRAFTSDLIFYPYGEWTDDELADEIEVRRRILQAEGDEGLDRYERAIADGLLTRSDARPWARQWAQLVLKRRS